jgi:hypothetical protein
LTDVTCQGEKYVVNPVDQAEAETARIPNSQFFVVKGPSLVSVASTVSLIFASGGPEAFAIVPACATIANRVYSSFLSRVTVPALPPPTKPRKEKVILSQALQILADIFGDPSIAKRKPTSLSFSMSSLERVQENAKYIAQFEKGEKKAVTALGKDGQPVRK